MYKVICKFADLKDNNRVYEVGDKYPRKGLNPTDERVEELLGYENKIGVPLIEKIEDKKKKSASKKAGK